MIFDLADDFQEVLAAIPLQHPTRGQIEHLSSAVVECIEGVIDRPWLLKQTVVNRIRCGRQSTAHGKLVERAEMQLDAEPTWLCAEHGGAPMRTWKDVVAVSIDRGLVHCRRRPGEIVDCQLATHRVLGAHRFASQTYSLISVHPVSGDVAMVEINGIVRSANLNRVVQLRAREPCFAYLGPGFVGIDPEHRLGFYRMNGEQVQRLKLPLPAIGCNVCAEPRGKSLVLLAGDRPRNQRILFLRWEEEREPSCIVWPAINELVTAAAVDPSETRVVLATIERELLLCNVASQQTRTRIRLNSLVGRPVATITDCALAPHGAERVLFADAEGVIGVWDIASGQIVRRGNYKSMGEGTPLVTLQWMADGERCVMATADVVRVFAALGPENVLPGTSVGDCAVDRDGCIALTNTQEKRVLWFKDDVEIGSYMHPQFSPNVIAMHGTAPTVVVGFEGNVLLLRPNQEPAVNDGWILFDRPVVSVLSNRGRVAAISIGGEVRTLNFREDPRPQKSLAAHWEHRGACLLGPNGAILCWGRSIADSMMGRLFVLRPNGATEGIMESRELIRQATAIDESRIVVAAGHSIRMFQNEDDRWRESASRDADSQTLCSCDHESFLVMRGDSPWLELWSAEDLSTLESVYVPGDITCLACSGSHIAMGRNDGSYVHITIRGTQWRLK